MARARNTKAVNLLLLDPSSQFTFNQFIDFETNKKLQESWINGYIDFHDNLCKKYNVINEMGCTHLDIDGTIKFNINSFMTQIHYLKSWYDQLFYRNKADIIKLVAQDYGYKISESKWNPEYLFGLESLREKLELKKEEILDICKKIYIGEKIDKKYEKFIDNLKEQIKMREKYLKGINDVKLKEILCCDSEKFKEWLYKKYLNLSKDKFNKKIIEINNSDVVQIAKDDDLINKINTCFWIEELIKFPRLKIDEIKCNDINKIKNTLLKNTEKLYTIYKNNNCMNKTIKSIKHKINSIINENYLQKFVAEMYNHIVNDLFIINSKQHKINSKLVRLYTIKIN